MSFVLRTLLLFVILILVGGFGYIATTDIPIAQETVTKKVLID